MCLCESPQRNVEHLSFAQSSKYGGYRVGLFSGELRGLGQVGFAIGWGGFFHASFSENADFLAASRPYVCVCVSVCVSVLEDLFEQMLKPVQWQPISIA